MSNVIDIAFSNTVKAVQERKGSRKAYQSMADQGSWTNTLDDHHRAFIDAQRSFYMSTVNADGQPYIQHRGGPKGFLKVMDDRTLGFVDYSGNRQFVSQGNLIDNSKAFIFLMDYENQHRLKIWGEAQVVEGDDHLIQQLMPQNYKAKPEQVIFFRIDLLEYNCRQHIPLRVDAEQVAIVVGQRDQRIAVLEQEKFALEAELERLKGV